MFFPLEIVLTMSLKALDVKMDDTGAKVMCEMYVERMCERLAFPYTGSEEYETGAEA